ncbi:L-threonylcarbamoyladenylate synthase [Jeotgalibacillus sp. R-1-5s-1]|uniref:L-threonylcarbamoyladenylate synthase n=1 Tax=Jeotgalibacillus sp. R-1-5s-1 TaxID=2555897 RepID=UPI00106D59DB|nr:L-threonylcarbamoyladenylate synthase [Jeotgalibacillus sp. R-1-5s-1]TFD96984.1 threonylcarbamoyl-AMP synthase [Jeotgalibacillus sp. R-1-5s-1]
MDTKRWTVDSDVDKKTDYPQLEEAAHFLQRGHVVAFPTETVYGLGADATSDAAVKGIFEAKGRPSDNPLIVHISSLDELDSLVAEVTDIEEQLMKAFWPGPLTIIFPKKEGVFSNLVTADLNSVGIRMPAHPVALELIRLAGKPLAAPSANTSGKPSPTTADHVAKDLTGRVAGIVDGGETGVGLESTVIDCTVSPPMILRPGGVSKEEIERCIGEVDIDPSLKKEDAPRSPGMKYTHYAPTAPMFLVKDARSIQEHINTFVAEGKKVGVLVTRETAVNLSADFVRVCGSKTQLDEVARQLYGGIRSFNDTDADVILAETYPDDGIGRAIMNRLEKAAGQKWID